MTGNFTLNRSLSCEQHVIRELVLNVMLLNCLHTAFSHYLGCHMQVVWQVLLSCLLQEWKDWHKWRALMGWCTSDSTLMGGKEHEWKEGCALLLSDSEKRPSLMIMLCFQYTLATDCFQLGYNAEGHCKGDVDSSLPRPQKLNWEIPPEVSYPFTQFP